MPGVLEGQVAIVSGGGRGIGLAIAHALAEAGAAVAVVARSESELTAAASTVRRTGSRALALPADVTDMARIRQVVDRTEQELGPVTLLVNNAGTPGPVGPDWEMATRQLTPPSSNGKTEINSQDPEDFDLEVFFNRVNQQMQGRFKGFAVILSDPNGDRLGFTRDGWAIDPDDSGPSELFTLDTPTAIGSVTKLFTTVAVLKRSTGAGQYRTLGERLQSRFSHFLPRRWWDDGTQKRGQIYF